MSHLQRRTSLFSDDSHVQSLWVTSLKISYDTGELRDNCCKFERSEELMGAHSAKIMIAMISDAEALENTAEWHEFLGHELLWCGLEGFQVAIGIEYAATFVPAGKKFAVSKDGKTVWSSVTRLKLIELKRQE